MPSRILSALIAMAASSPALAAPVTKEKPGYIDSIVGGIMAHEVTRSDEEDGVDLNLELRARPVLGKGWTVKVLPTIGGSLNTGGGTNTAYAGASARYDLTDSIFIEGFFGLAVHDAETPSSETALDLGCEVLFREAAELGYRHGNHAVSLHIAHASHGGILCDEDANDGITSVGVRYGVRF